MTKTDKLRSAEEIRTLGLLLIDGFSLMSYASVIEVFRAANALAGRTLYRWSHISVDGRPIHASNGATILADFAVGQPFDCETLFVFAGGDPTGFSDARTFAWLRRMAAQGAVITGVSAGPFLLARAGLLDGYRATIHWEHRPVFVETFPNVSPETVLFVIDRRRVTCAGGMAGLDLAIEMIEREQGYGLSSIISDWFIRTDTRRADRPQRLSLRERHQVSNDTVLKVLAHMEETVEEPSPRETLAKIAEVSVRQLERLFRNHLSATMRESYMRIRLEKSEQLLRTTALSVTQVALACGFQSASHVSRSFRDRYGKPPSGRARRDRES